MKPPRHRPPTLRRAGLAAPLLVVVCGASAQGLNATGVVGGLSIPDARSLGDGTVALGLGNPLEPHVVAQSSRRVSYVLGVGLAPGLDLVGRFAEYSTRRADGFLVGGLSDLSANVKFSTAMWQGTEAPRVALGVNDLGGGAVNFRAGYVVATQPWGRWSFTLGAGTSRAGQLPGMRRPLDGLFAGIDHRLALGSLPGALTISAEHDGRQALAGARWTSPVLPALAGGHLGASLHRTAERSALPGHTALGVFLTLPFGAESAERPAVTAGTVAPDPAAPRPPDAAEDSAPARLGRLQAALVELGLEKVRVGLMGRDWVVEYQNRRFGHSELDALGRVLGLAAQAASAAVERIVVVTLKTAQPALTVTVPARAWRDYLQDGREEPARAALQAQRGAGLDRQRVDWLQASPGPASRVQVLIAPDLSHTVGTEYGAADYALAARASVTVPLWTGAQLVVNAQELLAVSSQATETGVFANLRQPRGLRALAAHQTVWLGPHAVLGGAVGMFEHRAPGVEGEALFFVPGRDDVVRLRGRRLVLQPEMPPGSDLQQWVSYRWVSPYGGWARGTWVEVGAQRYADRSHGPMLTLSRWWGDVGAHLVYRKGGVRQFAGLELSFPLTPGAAPAGRTVQFTGASQWRTGLRTRLTDRRTTGNWIEPQAVRDFASAYDLEARALDAGRLGVQYTQVHVRRLRTAHVTASPSVQPSSARSP